MHACCMRSRCVLRLVSTLLINAMSNKLSGGKNSFIVCRVYVSLVRILSSWCFFLFSYKYTLKCSIYNSRGTICAELMYGKHTDVEYSLQHWQQYRNSLLHSTLFNLITF